MVLVGISVHVRTSTSVLLRTLDVRQIRRRLPGKRKASGMESNPVIVYREAIKSQPFLTGPGSPAGRGG
jgi:hypothetical protein